MARRAEFSLAAAVIAAILGLAACKPIGYYLQQVYKVHGTVTDAQTGEPLESAEVFIQSYQYSELTNGLGDFELELVAGTWTLDFTKTGYETQVRQVTVDVSNPRVRVDVALSPPAPPPPPPPGPWIVGYWVQSIVTAPHTTTLEFAADGTFTEWESYFASGEDIETYGTWSLVDTALTVNPVDHSALTVEITKVSDDRFVIPGTPGQGPAGTWYRRGTEPGGWAFDLTPASLDDLAWRVGEDVDYLSMKLYTFTAAQEGYYAPECSMCARVYAADKLTLLDRDWDEEEGDLDAVAMNPGDLIYVVVDGCEGGGTYDIRIARVQ